MRLLAGECQYDYYEKVLPTPWYICNEAKGRVAKSRKRRRSVVKTILITGGASGLGKGIAFRCLAQGDRVIAVGSSIKNGEEFLNEARRFGAGKRAIFFPANLSLISESRRTIARVRDTFPELDAVVFCASRHHKEHIETTEGVESSFALEYLSRFILSYGLKECLEKAENPIIMNVCGTGKRGKVNWKDLQHKNNFRPKKVMMHASRLNDLSAIAFAGNDDAKKISYVLYNPVAVHTSGMAEFISGIATKLYYRLAASPIDKAAIPIVSLLNNPPEAKISAFKKRRKVSLKLPTFKEENAQRLYRETTQLIEDIEAKASSEC